MLKHKPSEALLKNKQNYNIMKLLKYNPREKFNINHRKENKFSSSLKLMAIYKGQLIEIIDLRLYATNVRVYACAWVMCNFKGTKKHQNISNGQGSAFAGGYGYCKSSSACAYALNNAGLEFNKNADGVGMNTVVSQLEAFGAWLGYKNVHVVNSHG